jgi:hypothetical protein
MQWAGFNFSMNLSFSMCLATIWKVSAQCTYLLKLSIVLSGHVVYRIATVWQIIKGRADHKVELSDEFVTAEHPILHHLITYLLLSKEESCYVISCLPYFIVYDIIFVCPHHVSLAWVVLPPARQRKQTTFFSTRLQSSSLHLVTWIWLSKLRFPLFTL